MEGPSLVILAEELAPFRRKTVLAAEGNTSVDKSRMNGKRLLDILSWGKHLILQFDGFYIRIHFLMWGSYRINERKEGRDPRLALLFSSGEINFYSSSVKLVEGKAVEQYDWSIDLMSKAWDKQKALKAVAAGPDRQVGDLLLDQTIFAGLGNIMKNEVLWNLRLHPETRAGVLSKKQASELVNEAQSYAFQFYAWKKAYELKKHWQVYRQKFCPACGRKITVRPTGMNPRRSHFCEHCQPPYSLPPLSPHRSKRIRAHTRSKSN